MKCPSSSLVFKTSDPFMKFELFNFTVESICEITVCSSINVNIWYVKVSSGHVHCRSRFSITHKKISCLTIMISWMFYNLLKHKFCKDSCMDDVPNFMCCIPINSLYLSGNSNRRRPLNFGIICLIYILPYLPTRQSNDGFIMGINMVRELTLPLDPRLASNKTLTLNSRLFSIATFMVSRSRSPMPKYKEAITMRRFAVRHRSKSPFEIGKITVVATVSSHLYIGTKILTDLGIGSPNIDHHNRISQGQGRIVNIAVK
ncbi:hypothetical protein AGLY_007539 [Aphis glycines]|uniref:Uncharacterized protein n=1 Tax=Aphis glycines TaxID=307491 RepID=A0A6G0TMG9_APHGL|nr:hypothetical protein AGLY_007539 [Aphis glycines]